VSYKLELIEACFFCRDHPSTLFNQCYLHSLFYHHRHPVAALLVQFPWHFIPLTLHILCRLPVGLVTVPFTNDRECGSEYFERVFLFSSYVGLTKPLSLPKRFFSYLGVHHYRILTDCLSNLFFETRSMAAVIVSAVNVLLTVQFSITDICDES